MTKRKKIILSVSITIALVIVGVLIFFAVKSNESSAVAVVKVSSGDITETLDISGTVNSENQVAFEILDGTLVTKVNVRVGDQIKEGDILATFDTSSVSNVISEKRQAYKEAVSAYNDYISKSSDNSGKLLEITNQIADLENQISELSKKVEDKDNNQVEQTDKVIKLKDKFAEILGDQKMASDLIDRILGSSSDFSKTIELLENIANGINTQISGLTSLLTISEEESQLISLQIKLVQLKLEQGIMKLQSGNALEALYISVVEAAKEDLDKTLYSVEQLNRGWIAEKDGIVREINIVEGEYYTQPIGTNPSINDLDLTSIVSSFSGGSADFSKIISQLFPGTPSGMVLEYYPLSATFTVSKNDMFKIALKQPVKITAASGEEFEGYVSYVSPIATDSSSISINSVLGTGASSGGIECKVMIEKPNKNVIIGLDVDLSIKLESVKDAVLVPVESIQYSEEGAYIFIYDNKDKRINKTPVKTGLFDGSNYQIVSGCKIGDVIVKTPTQEMQDGQKISVKQ